MITVQRGTARPYYLASKGIRPEGVFVRQGSSSVPASETAILNMIKETSGDRYECARSLNQQLTFKSTTDYFKKKDVAFGEVQKKSLHLVGEDNTYTNLALLLSDQCVHTIKVGVFEGSKKSVFKDRYEFTGSLLKQLEECFSFIDRYNSTRAKFQGLDRIDERDYPVEAIRETLLNAIVHRAYELSPGTLVSIFGDRMDFVTIGGLMKGISLKDILLGVSALRNPHLAGVFYRLRLIEAFGTGILKINECYDGFIAKPIIEISDNAFKITLPNTNHHSENATKSTLSIREKHVIDLFENTERITRKDIEHYLGVSQATAIVLLREMTEKGLLAKTGQGKYVSYRLH
jgi:ATP-dependent DNA helicase RecG